MVLRKPVLFNRDPYGHLAFQSAAQAFIRRHRSVLEHFLDALKKTDEEVLGMIVVLLLSESERRPASASAMPPVKQSARREGCIGCSRRFRSHPWGEDFLGHRSLHLGQDSSSRIDVLLHSFQLHNPS